jgi:hypothetical protein
MPGCSVNLLMWWVAEDAWVLRRGTIIISIIIIIIIINQANRKKIIRDES